MPYDRRDRAKRTGDGNLMSVDNAISKLRRADANASPRPWSPAGLDGAITDDAALISLLRNIAPEVLMLMEAARGLSSGSGRLQTGWYLLGKALDDLGAKILEQP